LDEHFCSHVLSLSLISKLRIFTFTLSLLTPLKSTAEIIQANIIEEFEANVLSIGEDGSVMMHDYRGSRDLHVDLWGLSVVNLNGFRSFLVNRRVVCKTITDFGVRPEVDCRMLLHEDTKKVIIDLRARSISVLDWATDLGFTIKHCRYNGTINGESYLISDSSGVTWYCRGSKPSNGPSPSGPPAGDFQVSSP
jgi:hypothetical protein